MNQKIKLTLILLAGFLLIVFAKYHWTILPIALSLSVVGLYGPDVKRTTIWSFLLGFGLGAGISAGRDAQNANSAAELFGKLMGELHAVVVYLFAGLLVGLCTMAISYFLIQTIQLTKLIESKNQ